MKNLCFIIFILGATLLITSCDKENSASWENDRDNLIGQWTGTADFVKTFEDGSQETGQRPVSIEFITNEKASLNSGLFSNTLNWYYQPSPSRIIFTSTEGYTLSGQPSVFEVIVNGGNSQRWDTQFKDYDYNPTTMTSKMIEVVENWNVSKK